jgi:hypothetical protein
MSRWERPGHGATVVLSRLELGCLREGVAVQARGRIRRGCRRAAPRKRCRWLAHHGSTSRGHGRAFPCRFGQPSSWGGPAHMNVDASAGQLCPLPPRRTLRFGGGLRTYPYPIIPSCRGCRLPLGVSANGLLSGRGPALGRSLFPCGACRFHDSGLSAPPLW